MVKQNSFVARQSGVALFVSLIMLLILTIIGLSAAQRSNLQERMAANTHLQNVAYNAAESAIGGFVEESQTGNKLDPSHILYKLREQGVLNGNCFDQNGSMIACDGSIHLDGDKASAIVAQVDAKVLNSCDPTMCSGFSLGKSGGGGIGCRVFEISGTGTVGTASVTNTLTAYEVTVCTQ